MKMFEAAGDRLLALVVPRIVATADPGCECSGHGTQTVKCGCSSTAGSWHIIHRQKFTCNGCHWYASSRCNPDEVVWSC